MRQHARTKMIILSEVSNTEKDKHQISLKCEIKDMTQMNICTKQRHTHGHREQTCGFQGRQHWGRDGVRDWG